MTDPPVMVLPCELVTAVWDSLISEHLGECGSPELFTEHSPTQHAATQGPPGTSTRAGDPASSQPSSGDTWQVSLMWVHIVDIRGSLLIENGNQSDSTAALLFISLFFPFKLR